MISITFSDVSEESAGQPALATLFDIGEVGFDAAMVGAVGRQKQQVGSSSLVPIHGYCGQTLSMHEKGTSVRCIHGGGTGAIIGAAVGRSGASAAIGRALSTGIGMMIGNELENNEVALRSIAAQVWRQPRASPSATRN